VPPLPRTAQLAAARAYAHRSALIRGMLEARVLEAFDDVDDYSDEGDFVARVVPQSLAAQRSLSRYLTRYVYAVTDERPEDDLDVDELTGEALQPEGMAHHWSIPFYSMWKSLGAGVVFAEALAAARSDVGRQATTDLAFAQAATMARLAADVDGVEGYRRVLAGDGCEFCVEAADEIYSSDDLMPIHVGCNCSVAPVVGHSDPGATMNDSTLEGGPDG
jgi:hypothetical protein